MDTFSKAVHTFIRYMPDRFILLQFRNCAVLKYFLSKNLYQLTVLSVFFNRTDLNVSSDVLIETPNTGGVFLAARVDQGGESIRQAKGVFYWLYANGTYKVSNDIGNH